MLFGTVASSPSMHPSPALAEASSSAAQLETLQSLLDASSVAAQAAAADAISKLSALQNELERATAGLAASQAELVDARAGLATSHVEVADARAELVTAKAELANATCELTMSKAELVEAGVRLEAQGDQRAALSASHLSATVRLAEADSRAMRMEARAAEAAAARDAAAESERISRERARSLAVALETMRCQAWAWVEERAALEESVEELRAELAAEREEREERLVAARTAGAACHAALASHLREEGGEAAEQLVLQCGDLAARLGRESATLRVARAEAERAAAMLELESAARLEAEAEAAEARRGLEAAGAGLAAGAAAEQLLAACRAELASAAAAAKAADAREAGLGAELARAKEAARREAESAAAYDAAALDLELTLSGAEREVAGLRRRLAESEAKAQEMEAEAERARVADKEAAQALEARDWQVQDLLHQVSRRAGSQECSRGSVLPCRAVHGPWSASIWGQRFPSRIACVPNACAKPVPRACRCQTWWSWRNSSTPACVSWRARNSRRWPAQRPRTPCRGCLRQMPPLQPAHQLGLRAAARLTLRPVAWRPSRGWTPRAP